jgi:hypothetical protein
MNLQFKFQKEPSRNAGQAILISPTPRRGRHGERLLANCKFLINSIQNERSFGICRSDFNGAFPRSDRWRRINPDGANIGIFILYRCRSRHSIFSVYRWIHKPDRIFYTYETRQYSLDDSHCFRDSVCCKCFLTRAYVVPALPDPTINFGNIAVSKPVGLLLLFAVIMLMPACL